MHGMGEGDEPEGLARLRQARERIAAALAGIAQGAEALASRAAEAPNPSELDRLRAELEEERLANAQLEERIRTLRERERERAAAGEDTARAEVARLSAELEAARGEIARLSAEAEARRREVEAVLAELVPLVEEAR